MFDFSTSQKAYHLINLSFTEDALYINHIAYSILGFGLTLTSAVSPSVRPDPPVALNWTLLNISPSGLRYDVMVSWEPPLSAEVELGWMRLQYELRYREQNATKWQAVCHVHIFIFFFLLLITWVYRRC